MTAAQRNKIKAKCQFTGMISLLLIIVAFVRIETLKQHEKPLNSAVSSQQKSPLHKFQLAKDR